MSYNQLLISDIQWDTEGQTLEECNLPESVLIFDSFWVAPNEDELREQLGPILVDKFGFNHSGFKLELGCSAAGIRPNKMDVVFPQRLAVLRKIV